MFAGTLLAPRTLPKKASQAGKIPIDQLGGGGVVRCPAPPMDVSPLLYSTFFLEQVATKFNSVWPALVTGQTNELGVNKVL